MIAGRSISSRLTVWFSSVFFAGLILFGAIMWLNLRSTLMSGRRHTLERRADRLSELLIETQHDPTTVRAHKFEAFANATGGGLIEVLQDHGSSALPALATAQAFPWPANLGTQTERFDEVSVSGQSYLVLSRPFQSGSEALFLRVAAPLEANESILRAFSGGLLWTIPALLALSALGGYELSRRALSPVDQITAATRSISVSNISERLPVPQTRDELQRLSETSNAMLGRLESAVKEIQRFTADASHELRSPISFIRTVAEVALRSPQASSQRAFEEIVEECGKASRVLEDLLTLARADAGNAHVEFETVDLTELARAVCEKTRALTMARRQPLTVSLDAAEYAPVRGDYSSLRRMMWILLDNAAKYTRAPRIIHVVVATTRDEVQLSVEDNGIGISALDLPRIFERFYRADPSRSQVEGSGLGLSIAKWITDMHGARLSAESQENRGSIFRIAFPLFVDSPARLQFEGPPVNGTRGNLVT